MSLDFSKDHAEKLDQSDCVIVNASRRHPENQFYFKHLKQNDLAKIKELITKDGPGEVEVITNPVSALKVKDIILIHLPVWGQPEAEDQVTKVINLALE